MTDLLQRWQNYSTDKTTVHPAGDDATRTLGLRARFALDPNFGGPRRLTIA